MRYLKLVFTGGYIIVFQMLARNVLSAPRTVGLQPFFLYLTLISGSSIAALFGVGAFVAWLEEREEKGKNGQLLAAAKKRIKRRLFQLGLVAALSTILVVSLDNIKSLDWITPYPLMLILASLLGSIVAESAKNALTT